MLTSQRSGSSASMRDDVAALAFVRRCRRSPISSSTAKRTATAQRVADRLLGVLDQLAQQPHAVLERAAIFVGAVVVAGATRKCCRQRQVVAGIDIDDVEAGLLGAQRRGAVPAAEVADVGLSMARACTGCRLDRAAGARAPIGTSRL